MPRLSSALAETAFQASIAAANFGLDKLTEVFYEKALAGDVPSMLTVKSGSGSTNSLGMNSAAKIEIVREPLEAPDSFDKIQAAIMRKDGWSGGPDWHKTTVMVEDLRAWLSADRPDPWRADRPDAK